MAPLLDIFVLRLVLGVLIVLRTAAVAPLDGDRLFVNPDPTGINLISTLKILNPTTNNCQQFSHTAENKVVSIRRYLFASSLIPCYNCLNSTFKACLRWR